MLRIRFRHVKEGEPVDGAAIVGARGGKVFPLRGPMQYAVTGYVQPDKHEPPKAKPRGHVLWPILVAAGADRSRRWLDMEMAELDR